MSVFVKIIFLSFMILSACTRQKTKVDFIVKNAKIYTVNGNFDIVQSLAVKNGKFIATGSNDSVLDNFFSDDVIDLQGKTIFPGFYDAHCHFYGYGLDLQQANLVGTKSFEEIVGIVKEHALKHQEEWIFGRGWDQNDWKIKEFPVNSMLNLAFPNRPVVLTRIDGHAVIANAEALKRANITINSKIDGGKILVKDGKPTGLLIDNAINLLMKSVPKNTPEIITNALLAAQQKCFSVGLTTVDDAGLSKETVVLIDQLQNEGKLKMRIYAMLDPSEENFEYFVKKGIYKTEKLNVRSIKLYADGALGSRGAALISDYSDDPGNKGLILTKPEEIEKICKLAIESQYQVNTHAIGDSANRLMLRIYGKVLKEKNDRRWRIEHAQVIHPDDFKLFAGFSIVPSVQPTHATSDMYWAAERLGKERVKFAYAYKLLMEQNGWIPLGSDFPVEDINPLYGFYAAVSRKDLKNYPENGFQTENALTREQALKGMTIWAAKSNFEEKERGSIEPGKMADFVVLQDDIMVVPINRVPEVKVHQTYIGGEKVFGN
ncbi:MAG: amidohydrolase family protein [Bacteroidales bacterium]